MGVESQVWAGYEVLKVYKYIHATLSILRFYVMRTRGIQMQTFKCGQDTRSWKYMHATLN